MWSNRKCAILYIAILYLQHGVSALNCDPEQSEECVKKKAVCHIEDDSYVCECPEGKEMSSDDDQCKDIDMCDDNSQGHRYCDSENALCKNAPEASGGYVCFCPKGKVKINDFCTETKTAEPEMTETPNAQSTSTVSSLLSSPVSSSSGIENTPTETLDSSSKTDYFTFSTLHSIQPSSISSVSLTTLNDHLGSTNSMSISDTLDEDECLKHCSKNNARCIKMSHSFTCSCKSGFVPHEDFPKGKAHCLRNCTRSGCEELCKEMMCVPREKKKNGNDANVYLENKLSGWPMAAKLTCAFLACLVVILVFFLIYVLYRYLEIRKSRRLEENQVVYQKMNKGVHTESKDTLVTGYI